METHYDFIVIGGGATGFAAVMKANQLGKKALMVNEGLPLGGTCVNVGCVPSKFLLHTGRAVYQPAHPRFQSVGGTKPAFSLPKAIEEKDEVVQSMQGAKYQEVLDDLEHVEFLKGRARFRSPKEVEVGGRVFGADKILIATGSSTRALPVKGVETVSYLNHIALFSLKELPKTLVILGGGFIAMECAQMFSRFGSQVTVIQRSPRVLSREEPEVSEAAELYLSEEGIRILTGVNVKGLKEENGEKVVIAEQDKKQIRISGEILLMATGIQGNTLDLNLDAAGLFRTKDGCLEVNDFLETKVKGIYAAGDVAGPPFLETVAAKQGSVAADNALADGFKKINYDAVPHAVFTDPEIASVGYTEARLMEEVGACDCRTIPLSMVPKAGAVKESRGLIKIVAHHETGKVMGVHIVAPLAADMIHEAVLAVQFGLTIDDLIDVVHVFPTYSEGIKLCAQAYRRNVEKMACCVE